jgi:hypothetical protein
MRPGLAMPLPPSLALTLALIIAANRGRKLASMLK